VFFSENPHRNAVSTKPLFLPSFRPCSPPNEILNHIFSATFLSRPKENREELSNGSLLFLDRMNTPSNDAVEFSVPTRRRLPRKRLPCDRKLFSTSGSGTISLLR